jgi:ParB family chromosome partitioning protein
MAQKKRPVTKTGRPRKRKGVKLEPTALTPPELALTERPPELDALARQVGADGGAVLAAYREPLGGHPLLFVALPVDRVERTPFQRDVWEALRSIPAGSTVTYAEMARLNLMRGRG